MDFLRDDKAGESDTIVGDELRWFCDSWMAINWSCAVAGWCCAENKVRPHAC